jgi:hypothetical protein
MSDNAQRAQQLADARALVGKRVRWAHLPQGVPFQVLAADDDGMVEIEGFTGLFSPGGFVPVDED